MTVADLVAYLQKQPQQLTVVYKCYSEYDTLEAKDISIEYLCEQRPDGWVHSRRSDKRNQQYLVFPGN